MGLVDNLEAAIERRRLSIARLRSEVATLRQQLANAKEAERARGQLARSSSIGRALAEQAILERLRANAPPETSADQLWIAAESAGVRSRSTLRSHLMRMRAKGLIENPARGRWRLAPGVMVERRLSAAVQAAVKALDETGRNRRRAAE